MPRRKPFQQMTDEELTDAAIVRRVFPASMRKQLRQAVSELQEQPKKRKAVKKARKR